MQFMANFKCNHTAHSVQAYFTHFNRFRFSREFMDRHEIVFFPPALALQAALDHADLARFTIGAQNAYPARSGAYTGEIGLEALESMHIGTILLGHSERRMLLGESQELIARKFAFFSQQGFRVVYCIGEPLSVRERGDIAVQEYLRAQFEGVAEIIEEMIGGARLDSGDSRYARVSVAYEPIWAIGTGVSAKSADIESTHAFLRTLTAAPLLYGGSVNASNAREILSLPNVNGVLVGSAALEPKSFYDITQSIG